MSVVSRARPLPAAPLIALGLAGLLAAAAGWSLSGGGVAELWLLVFAVLAGLVVGSLGLLMIGHLMSEEWVNPIRSEAEAAALTAPLLPLLALPFVFLLDELYPWASGAIPNLPAPRAHYLSPQFFLLRSAFYLTVWIALALWIVRTDRPRRASAIGIALLAATASFAANDWILSRDPLWWSTLFGFAYGLSQLLAALSGAILISLLRRERPGAVRMQSLERALLTLALLVLWSWFVQFLIVWLANLPAEAAWYLARSQGRYVWLMLAIAAPTLLAAIVILAPPGFGRRTMMVGSALLLVHHAAHMAWLVGPAAAPPNGGDVAVAAGVALAWGAGFAAALRSRPADASHHKTPA